MAATAAAVLPLLLLLPPAELEPLLMPALLRPTPALLGAVPAGGSAAMMAPGGTWSATQCTVRSRPILSTAARRASSAAAVATAAAAAVAMAASIDEMARPRAVGAASVEMGAGPSRASGETAAADSGTAGGMTPALAAAARWAGGTY